MINKCIGLIILCGLFATQGCLAAAVGYAGYTMGSSKEEAAQKEADVKNLQTYNSYKTDLERLNFDRERAGMKPQPIMTFAEWKLAHNIPTPATEPKAPAKTSESKSE
jgi:hypothetical protein